MEFIDKIYYLILSYGIKVDRLYGGFIIGVIFGVLFFLLLYLFLKIFRRKDISYKGVDRDRKENIPRKSDKERDIDLKIELYRLKKEEKEKLEESFKNGALYTLAILQNKGRLVDFLKEDIDSFDDEQIGSAVREIHRNCRKVLDEYFSLKPVLNYREGEEIKIDRVNFNPSAMRVIGNFSGLDKKECIKGVLRHKGWKANRVKLPNKKMISDSNYMVIYPAEIDL